MNFGGNEVVYSYPESAIAIIPVPYDGTSTWIKGADAGPEALLQASVNLEFYDVETRTEVHKRGIFTMEPLVVKSTPGALVDSVGKEVSVLLNDNKFPVLIGGNHTVSIGAIRAFSEFYGDFSVLQLDAHTDLRNEYEGSEYNHACVMARARETAMITQVGIRSMSAEEIPSAERSNIFYAHDLYYDKGLYDRAIESLNKNVYITFDLDVLDPSLMPSTGTPEPGGPDYFEIMHFVRKVAERKNIVGFDIVELCPSPENKAPDFVAAKILYQLLSYIFSNRRA